MRKAASCGGLSLMGNGDPTEESMVRIASPRSSPRSSPRNRKNRQSSLSTEQPIPSPAEKEGDMAAGSSAQLYISHADPSQENFASDCRKVIWLDALNMGPTLAVLLTAFAFFSLLSLFLDTYVATAEQSIAVFAIGSYVVFTSYFTFHYYLEKFSTSYKNVEPDKQFYVLSNLIKSATLLSYTPLAAIVLYKTMVLDDWDTTRIRNLGCMYAIPDFVSLFLVKRMSNTTIVHHLAVCIFNVVSMFNDYSEENICRLMVVYAIFSTFAYLVNLLLASRFLNIPKWVAQYMSGMALLIYASCCGINWTWQTIYTWKLLRTGHTYPVYAYVALILMVVWDDLVLMKWLWFKATQCGKKKQRKDMNTQKDKEKQVKQQ